MEHRKCSIGNALCLITTRLIDFSRGAIRLVEGLRHMCRECRYVGFCGRKDMAIDGTKEHRCRNKKCVWYNQPRSGFTVLLELRGTKDEVRERLRTVMSLLG